MKEIILFDLDGTLTESGIGIMNGAVYALSKFGIEVKDRDELRRFIGPPLVWSFKEFYGFTDEQALEAEKIFRDYYSEKGMFENAVYDGVHETLGELKRRGYTLMVATAKPEFYAIPILEHFDLKQYFDFVGGALMEAGRKNKVEVLQYVLEHEKLIDLDKVLMVGDRYHDVEGAHAVGIECAGVLYGYGDREELEKAGAEYIVEKAENLLDIL